MSLATAFHPARRKSATAEAAAVQAEAQRLAAQYGQPARALTGLTWRRASPQLGVVKWTPLVALALLGLIAAFAIPKILGGGDDKKYVIFKETLSTIQAAFAQGILNKEIRTTSDYNLMKSYMNHVQACPALCSSGCSSGAQNRSNEPGFRLHNGASFCGLNQMFTADDVNENVSLDWNGPDGPNVTGDDTIVGTAAARRAGCAGSYGRRLATTARARAGRNIR